MKEAFDPHDDYLDMVLQLGYIVQFTTAWPFCALCGLTNNYFEFHGDLFRLFNSSSKPIPMAQRNIGPWQEAIMWVPCFSVPVSAGLVCYSTGGLDRFSGMSKVLKGVDMLLPDPGCFDNEFTRPFVWVCLMGALSSVIYWIFRNMSAMPSDVRKFQGFMDAQQVLETAHLMLPKIDPRVEQNLKIIFDKFALEEDEEQDPPTLRFADLRRLMDMTQKVRGLKPLSPQHITMLFEYMDVLKDDTISFTEFSSGLAVAQDNFVLQQSLQLETSEKWLACSELMKAYVQGTSMVTNSPLRQIERRLLTELHK